MQNIPSYKEDHSSQIPALQLLQNLGYTYLTPDEALRSRGGKRSNVLLEDILEKQLRKLNSIQFKGKTTPFSDANIANAVHRLKDFPLVEGLLRTNEKVFHLLTLGASFPQNIDGDEKSFSLRYIDWQNPDNNEYHVTEEFSVERTGSLDTYRPDIVLFVNGIPFVVIECKRADLKTKADGGPLSEAISQQIRNQKADGIPHLFIYSQLLISICTNAGKYATTSSAVKFWFKWREKFERVTEEQGHAQRLDGLKNAPLKRKQKDRLFGDRFKYVRAYFDALDKTPRAVTEQDRLLYALCRPQRLLELTYRYIVFDAGIKKIAQYQQYFAVKKGMRRIENYIENRRGGGVIWHTQGSGKSITMVMLAKAVALDTAIREPRIVLVTDRVDLDKQIRDTFAACDAEVVGAQSGNHLVELITDNRSKIITTIVNKFSQAFQRGVRNESREIFVLVDESHRSHYGQFNIDMQRVFPNACYIGFTGTPLLKKDKSTVERFGGIIDAYPMEQAVADEAVLPLLYEGRLVVQDVNETSIDAFFDLISADLTEAQKADLKRKFSRADQLNEAEQKILRTCWDISLHYNNEWKGTGFKGQLATPSKAAALKYKLYLDQIGKVTSEVLISPPDTREGHEDVYDDVSDEVQRFWKGMMEKYGSEKRYNDGIIDSFKWGDEPEILIVVDKYLVGFDAPRNTVLYLAKSLREHSLLQAVARVNRIFEGKEFGYIIDYYGLLGELDRALTTYGSLAGFEEADLTGTLTHVRGEIEKLAERHAQLWDIFKSVTNRRDPEQYEQLLRDEALREAFYERLSLFARTLKLALSTLDFMNSTKELTVQTYKTDAKFFLSLRASVMQRYSDTINYTQYEAQIQNLIDNHVSSNEVIQLTEQVNIFNKEAFSAEVERVEGTAARADVIASRTAKSITEKMDEDPAFYKKFSEMLQKTIDDYTARRLSEVEYLKRVTDIMDSVRDRTGDDTPDELRDRDTAKAFYGVAYDTVTTITETPAEYQTVTADVSLKIDDIIREHLVVDWQMNRDVQKRMEQEIEDYLFSIKGRYDLDLSWDDIDTIIAKVIEIAKHRYE